MKNIFYTCAISLVAYDVCACHVNTFPKIKDKKTLSLLANVKSNNTNKEKRPTISLKKNAKSILFYEKNKDSFEVKGIDILYQLIRDGIPIEDEKEKEKDSERPKNAGDNTALHNVNAQSSEFISNLLTSLSDIWGEKIIEKNEELSLFLEEIRGSVVTYNTSLSDNISSGFYKKTGETPILQKPIFTVPRETLSKMFPNFKKYVILCLSGKVSEVTLWEGESFICYFKTRVLINPLYAELIELTKKGYERGSLFYYLIEQDLSLSNFYKSKCLSYGCRAIIYRNYVLLKAE